MGYHIDTGLIKEKFNTDCECPLCEIKKIVEEQFLHEFLNDAVMEENTRIEVARNGFCAHHFDMLLARQNKLSVALQIDTRADILSNYTRKITTAKEGKKIAEQIARTQTTCVICSLTEKSMVKYYKTVAQLFNKEKDFIKTLISCKGFCLNHYAELLSYASYAGFMKNEYVSVLSSAQNRNFDRLRGDLKAFCDKHDYRRANEPLGSAETALPRMRIKLYGDKTE